MLGERDRLQEELNSVEVELSRLDKSRQMLLQRQESLIQALRESEEAPFLSIISVAASITKQSSPADKISLFGALFRGREDVFPRRFENMKTGKSGYQPACHNEWKPGVCSKPKVKCAVCKTRAFIPIAPNIFDAHLRGHLHGEKADKDFTMGVYPMLIDETCYFLAVDFDKDTWREDSLAYLETCGRYNVPAYLERSRSGNGGHVWIFFDQPVPTKTARQLGAFILTETMERYPNLGFESYDRFFPNQDTLPQGGFGNLIALPLQKRPRANGNSLFLNLVTFEPWADQWAALASFEKMPLFDAQSIVIDAERSGRVLGVKIVEAEDELEQERPWDISPSYNHLQRSIQEPLPEKMTLTLSDGVYIEKAELTPALRSRLIRVAAFQNPEFYKDQTMRLPTWGKARIISCCREFLTTCYCREGV